MNRIKVWMDIGLVTITNSWRWILGGTAVFAAVVVGLFAAGIFGNGKGASVSQLEAPDPTTARSNSLTPIGIVSVNPTSSPTPENRATQAPMEAPSIKVDRTLLEESTPTPTQVLHVPINLLQRQHAIDTNESLILQLRGLGTGQFYLFIHDIFLSFSS